MLNEHLNLLGLKVKDQVTGCEGVVTSISFDLYGCIQAVIQPPTKEGKKNEPEWFDVTRLKITNKKPVMNAPDFTGIDPVAKGEKGPAEKPLP